MCMNKEHPDFDLDGDCPTTVSLEDDSCKLFCMGDNDYKRFLKENSEWIIAFIMVLKNMTLKEMEWVMAMADKNIGKKCIIIDKESIYYDEWGVIKFYDGEYYHVSIANGNSTVIFDRKQIKIPRKKRLFENKKLLL